MTTFQFDTSGVVYGQSPQWGGTCVFWSQLSPFVQGYVEAQPRLRIPAQRRAFKNPKHQQAYDWYLSNQPDPEAHKGKGAMGNAYAVGRTLPDSPHAFAVRGSLAYATWCAGVDLAKGRDAGFSDLAPETLARIMEDCEAYARSTELPEGLKFHGSLQQAQIAASFWECRQNGAYPHFPPLTVYLGDDGKVHLRDTSNA